MAFGAIFISFSNAERAYMVWPYFRMCFADSILNVKDKRKWWKLFAAASFKRNVLKMLADDWELDGKGKNGREKKNGEKNSGENYSQIKSYDRGNSLAK